MINIQGVRVEYFIEDAASYGVHRFYLLVFLSWICTDTLFLIERSEIDPLLTYVDVC